MTISCEHLGTICIDWSYEWAPAAISVLLLAFVFNFIAKRLLDRLHLYFVKQNKIWTDGFVQSLRAPLRYYIWLLAIIQSFDFLATHVIAPIPANYHHMIIVVGGVAALTWFLIRWKQHIIFSITEKSKRREVTVDEGTISAVDKIVTIGIIFFSFLFLLEATNQNVQALIAFGGVGGLALAFASQEIIANFFGGFMLYLTKPFTVGDRVQLPDHKIEGIVEEIGWYMTRLRALDKQPIYVPNSLFSKLIMITPSRMTHRQIKETLGVRYDDMGKVKTVTIAVKEMLEHHAEIDKGQPIIVRLASFGEYSLNIYVSAYTKTTDFEGFMRVKEDVLLQMANILSNHEVELAFPTQHLTFLSPPPKTEL